MTTPDEFRESFERRGKSNVRAFIEAGRSRAAAINVVLDDGTLEAIRWMEELETKEALEASSKRDAREEETLSIARDANRIASRAERWAMYAAIAAVIALIISIAHRTFEMS